jgi:uncharacterized protein YndB with AHSA1/START domain
MTTKKRPAHQGKTIRTQIRTSASPDQLWEAWADPEKLAQWFPDRAEGRAAEGAVQTWYFDRFKYALPYEIASAVPGEHLVFTGQPPGRPRFFLEIEIAREGGSTRLTLANSGFLDKEGWDEEYEGIVSGWQMSLALLKLYVERYYGRARSQFFAMRPAQYSYRDLLRLYREEDELSRWLTTAGRVGESGRPYELALREGGLATGEVLAVTGWEVLLSWNEIEGALALKGFSLGQAGRAICIHGSSWGLPAHSAAEFETKFSPALERLAAALEHVRASV